MFRKMLCGQSVPGFVRPMRKRMWIALSAVSLLGGFIAGYSYRSSVCEGTIKSLHGELSRLRDPDNAVPFMFTDGCNNLWQLDARGAQLRQVGHPFEGVDADAPRKQVSDKCLQ